MIAENRVLRLLRSIADDTAVLRHVGAHSEVDRTYAALGTYAAAHGRDGTGPVRERYLADPLDTPDITQWRTEICRPLAPRAAAGTPATPVG